MSDVKKKLDSLDLDKVYKILDSKAGSNDVESELKLLNAYIKRLNDR